ncbi:MAG: hypothetical protein GOP50_01330 [Candidatus Heimdallarchaeota archaeon]|nr:hypothetical protein [Candidatus Heimdallarchaeota archaeon]
MSDKLNRDCFKEKIMNCLDRNEYTEIISRLRIFVSNNRSEIRLVELVEIAIDKAEEFNNYETIVNLYGLKILLLENRKENLIEISKVAEKMESFCREKSLQEELALTYSYKWFIEKIKGNKRKGEAYIEEAFSIINSSDKEDQYIVNFVKYSYAVHCWLEKHDEGAVKLFESCLGYFYENNLNRSLIQTVSILGLIYTRQQNGARIIKLSKEIFNNTNLFDELSCDAKAISYYFLGLGYMLDLSLNFADSSFQKAYRIFKNVYKKSIYFSNFIILHSYIVTVKALQGKLEQTWGIIRDVENLLQAEFFEKNLDSGTKKQIVHTLNLNKFYVYSRLNNFDAIEKQDLIKEIFDGSKTLYSDFMLLSEYILNANLEPSKLEELLNTSNFSIDRVKHLISFTLLGKNGKTVTKGVRSKKIELLRDREKTSKTTFVENVYADSLIAQQLFSLKRYEEIYPLLMKYEKKLHRIEVLELRIFMEAFIQVGAYKSGDPLGPALQYMAIKKCQQYGFSRLENRLLDYLNLQSKDKLKIIT